MRLNVAYFKFNDIFLQPDWALSLYSLQIASNDLQFAIQIFISRPATGLAAGIKTDWRPRASRSVRLSSSTGITPTDTLSSIYLFLKNYVC
jgi:hypothetical protein